MAKLSATEDSILLSSSSFLGSNSSYSGTDIKVLVHIYDPNEAGKILQEKQYRDFEALDKEQQQLQGKIASLEYDLSVVHPNTPEEEKLKNLLLKARKDNKEVEDAWLGVIGANNSAKEKEIIGAVKVLAELQTLSISTYRDKREVRALGHVYSKGTTRGPRTVSGSMIFTVFNKHVLEEVMQSHSSEFDAYNYTSVVADQIPPMDVTIVFANELGKISRMAIYGVEFVNEGMVLSIENMFTESTFSFIARDFDPMRAVSERKIDKNNQLMNEWAPKRASDLIFEEDAWEEKTLLNPFERFYSRNDPFK